MVVVVEYRIGQTLRHVTNLLSLGYDIQGSVLDVLKNIRSSVRTMKIHITLGLAYEGHIPHRLEELPDRYEVLYYADVGTGLEISADIESRDKFKSLVLGIGGRSLSVKVEVVGICRCLEISLLERLAMPYTISLFHMHVIHVNRNPHIGGSVSNLVIDGGIDDEVVGLHITVLDVIYARLPEVREIKLGIVVFVVRSPHGHLSGECLGRAAVSVYLIYACV